tara:strand:+ start:612 stop:1871 length:1260 start_codon:yes stop_codon:yes gene_type:complete
MNVYYSYGKLKSDSKKKEQTVYVRLFYGRNKIQVKASTQLVIQKHGWNFKKGEKAGVIDLLKGERTYEESQHFQEVQNKLDHIRNYLKNEFRKLKLSQKHSTFNQKEWNNWAREQFEIALGIKKAKSEGAELFLTKYDDYLKISSIDFSKNTIADYNSIRKKIVAFEQYKKRKYKTDEIDLLFYADFHEWCFGVSGIKTNTFGSYIAKIKAVINHFRTSETSFKFHVNIAHKKFKTLVDVHDYEILDTKELELLWSYKGKAYLENVRDISKFLYYICLRWNEFYYEFKERKGEHRIHTIEEENGKESYVWDIKESKVKARKEVPVHKVLLDMWKGEQMPYYISAQKFNDYIKELCKEVGIKKYKSISSHCFRRSFCTNMRNAKHDEKYIIEYSGHTTVKALKNYISKKHTNKDNTIPTK